MRIAFFSRMLLFFLILFYFFIYNSLFYRSWRSINGIEMFYCDVSYTSNYNTLNQPMALLAGHWIECISGHGAAISTSAAPLINADVSINWLTHRDCTESRAPLTITMTRVVHRGASETIVERRVAGDTERKLKTSYTSMRSVNLQT